MTRMYKPTTAYLSKKPDFEGQYADQTSRPMHSALTSDGIEVEFSCAQPLERNNPLCRQTLDGKYALDGLCLCFADFEYSGKSDFSVDFTDENGKKLSVCLGTDAPCIKADQISVALDAITLCKENLKGKQFKLEWKKEAVYTLYITIDDKTVTAALDIKDFKDDAVSVAIAANGIDNEFKIKCNGVFAKTNGVINELVEEIDGLADTVTKQDADKILSLYEKYLSLSTKEQLYVFNAAKLNGLRLQLRVLDGVDKDGRDKDGFYIPKIEDVSEKSGTPTRKAQSQGLELDFTNNGFGQRQFTKERLVAEDITIRLDNFRGISGSLAVGLTSAPYEGWAWGLESMQTRYGMYFVIGRDSRAYITKPFDGSKKMLVLFEDEAFSRENLYNKEILFRFVYEPQTKAITVTVTVGSKSFTKELDDFGINLLDNMQRIFSQSLDSFKYQKVQVVIQNVCNYNPKTGEIETPENRSALAVDLTGIKFMRFSTAQQVLIDQRQNEIDALPENPTIADKEAVDKTWISYFQLKYKKLRGGVENYDRLLSIHDKLFKQRMQGKKAHHYEGECYKPDDTIDNSGLINPYIPQEEIEFDSQGIWPNWVKDAVMTCFRVERVTPEGTLMALEPVLKHCAELGVNLIWLNPIEDKGISPDRSFYTNYGPHTINPYITGQLKYGEEYDESKVDYEAGWKVFADFVELAHKYNIRIFIDKISWGLAKESPLIAEHPDWVDGFSSWGGPQLNLKNEGLREFYKNTVIDILMKTNVDGVRWDLAPHYFDNEYIAGIRQELNKRGKKPVFIGEDQVMHGEAYAFEQFGVNGIRVSAQLNSPVFLEQNDIVDAIRTGANVGGKAHPPKTQTYGTGKYYTYQVSCHDSIRYRRPSIGEWAYEFVFGSFIPMFYFGEQWHTKWPKGLYGATINWDELKEKEHKDYFETLKKLMSLRWKYKDIVNSDADNHRDTNICTVDLLGTDLVKGYARYKDNQAIIVVPNFNERSKDAAIITAEIPLKEMGLEGYKNYTLVDLMTDKQVVSGTADEVMYFSRKMEHFECDIYLLTAQD